MTFPAKETRNLQRVRAVRNSRSGADLEVSYQTGDLYGDSRLGPQAGKHLFGEHLQKLHLGSKHLAVSDPSPCRRSPCGPAGRGVQPGGLAEGPGTATAADDARTARAKWREPRRAGLRTRTLSAARRASSLDWRPSLCSKAVRMGSDDRRMAKQRLVPMTVGLSARGVRLRSSLMWRGRFLDS